MSDNTAITSLDTPPRIRRPGDLLGAFLLSYLVGIALIIALIHNAGWWNFLANTRLLSLLIDGGVVRYHDMQIGFIQGVPDVKHYLFSQDPIGWHLLLVMLLLILLYWLVKAYIFHGIARLYGLGESLGAHTRAYFYGVGINSVMPYNTGELATALALEGQGRSFQAALSALFTARLFVVFEIVVFALVGLLSLGWDVWLTQIFWGLAILGVLYFFTRAHSVSERTPLGRCLLQVYRDLSQQPLMLAQLVCLSLLAFFLEHVAAYCLVMAFTSLNVILNVEFSALLMGVLGGYIARLIPLTPGGIGQFEWGFAAALYLGGLGFPEAATIAILYGLSRYLIGVLLTLVVRLSYGVEIRSGAVLARFAG